MWNYFFQVYYIANEDSILEEKKKYENISVDVVVPTLKSKILVIKNHLKVDRQSAPSYPSRREADFSFPLRFFFLFRHTASP